MSHRFINTLLSLLLAILLSSQVSFSQTGAWQRTNGPYGGRVEGLAVTSAGSLLAGTRGHSIFRSTDNGANWSFVTYLGREVRCFAVGHNSEVYAGTTEGLYRSSSDGATWQRVLSRSPLPNTDVPAIVVDSAGHIFVGTRGDGVFVSKDNAENWTPLNNGMEREDVLSLAFGQRHTLFAGTYNGLFRSVDNGVSWHKIEVLQKNLSQHVYSIAINDVGQVFIGHGWGIHRSEDNGTSWTPTSVTSGTLSISIGTTSSVMAGTTRGVFYSRDSGRNWSFSNSSREADSTYPGIGQFVRLPNGTVYAGTARSGIIRSDDDGLTWKKMNSGLACARALSIAISPSGSVFAGTYGGGIFRSDDLGENWMATNRGIEWTVDVFSVAIREDGVIFAAAQGGVYRSEDDGHSWKRERKDMNTTFCATVSPVGEVLVGGSGGVFRLGNDNTSWVNIGDPSVLGVVWALAVEKSGAIYAGTDRGLYKSVGNTGEWQNVRLGGTHPMLISNQGELFIGIGNGSVQALLRSTDNGNTWSEVLSTGIPCSGVSSIAEDSTGGLYVTVNFITGDGAVYFSPDRGRSWEQLLTSKAKGGIWGLAVLPNGHVLAGVSGSGVLVRKRPTTTPVAHDERGTVLWFDLGQNYPNPFNPSTSIQFSIPRSGHVSLKVFNVLGNTIATLVNQDLPLGTHKAEWNAGSLPSGVYFYRLVAGSFVETKKMLLLR